MLDDNIVSAEVFRMTRDKLKERDSKDLKLSLIKKRCTDGMYNMLTSSEVASVLVWDIGFEVY